MNKNVWIIIGMATQAIIAGSMAAIGLITITAIQQAIAAGVFVIVCFVFSIIARELNKFIMEMGIQAFLTSILLQVGLNLTYKHQFAAALFLGAIVLYVYTIKQQEVRR